MKIIGYDKKEIKTITAFNNNDTIAVLYPGRGYFLNAAVFDYLGYLLTDMKIDILGIDTRYSENSEINILSIDKQKEWFYYDSVAIGNEIKHELEKYKRKIFIGKSLGTAHIRKNISDGIITEDSLLVWLTPAFEISDFYEYLKTLKHKSLIIYGTKDPFYSEKCIGKITNTDNITVLEIPETGHSFEVDGNVDQSIENIKVVINAIRDFIKEDI
ncbi:MAG TPA: alpha/beta hydrolase [Patescibacteria group bacterium]|nr:alpha/beta hydrolase [Patescibacteria group bacterium]